jgi:hypothetical protein
LFSSHWATKASVFPLWSVLRNEWSVPRNEWSVPREEHSFRAHRVGHYHIENGRYISGSNTISSSLFVLFSLGIAIRSEQQQAGILPLRSIPCDEHPFRAHRLLYCGRRLGHYHWRRRFFHGRQQSKASGFNWQCRYRWLKSLKRNKISLQGLRFSPTLKNSTCSAYICINNYEKMYKNSPRKLRSCLVHNFMWPLLLLLPSETSSPITNIRANQNMFSDKEFAVFFNYGCFVLFFFFNTYSFLPTW